MRKVCLARTCKCEQTTEFLSLVSSFLVRIRVLLEALDTVLQFWTAETRE